MPPSSGRPTRIAPVAIPGPSFARGCRGPGGSTGATASSKDGLLIGLATAPILAYYATANPAALWQSGGATALFIAGFGAAGYSTRRDLTAIARVSSWALIDLIVFGIVLIFVQIPNGSLIYSVLGLVIFAGLTAFDFQRLRNTTDLDSAPLLAVSIFLDILNVFLFFRRSRARGLHRVPTLD